MSRHDGPAAGAAVRYVDKIHTIYETPLNKMLLSDSMPINEMNAIDFPSPPPTRVQVLATKKRITGQGTRSVLDGAWIAAKSE